MASPAVPWCTMLVGSDCSRLEELCALAFVDSEVGWLGRFLGAAPSSTSLSREVEFAKFHTEEPKPITKLSIRLVRNFGLMTDGDGWTWEVYLGLNTLSSCQANTKYHAASTTAQLSQTPGIDSQDVAKRQMYTGRHNRAAVTNK